MSIHQCSNNVLCVHYSLSLSCVESLPILLKLCNVIVHCSHSLFLTTSHLFLVFWFTPSVYLLVLLSLFFLLVCVASMNYPPCPSLSPTICDHCLLFPYIIVFALLLFFWHLLSIFSSIIVHLLVYCSYFCIWILFIITTSSVMYSYVSFSSFCYGLLCLQWYFHFRAFLWLFL